MKISVKNQGAVAWMIVTAVGACYILLPAAKRLFSDGHYLSAILLLVSMAVGVGALLFGAIAYKTVEGEEDSKRGPISRAVRFILFKPFSTLANDVRENTQSVGNAVRAAEKAGKFSLLHAVPLLKKLNDRDVTVDPAAKRGIWINAAIFLAFTAFLFGDTVWAVSRGRWGMAVGLATMAIAAAMTSLWLLNALGRKKNQ